MWGEKKPDAPARTPVPQQPRTTAPQGSSFTGEARTMAPLDSTYPAATPSGNTARLGPSLHIKGEITGNEDLHLDGSVEGLVHLDDKKLTVGASARVTGYHGTGSGCLRQRERVSSRADGIRDQEGWLGNRRSDDRAHHDRGRGIFQG